MKLVICKKERKTVICEYVAHPSLICIHIYVKTNDKSLSSLLLLQFHRVARGKCGIKTVRVIVENPDRI